MVDAVVVDDSQFMRVQIREILEEHGVTVLEEAQNGKAAVDAVEAHDPDVVTMDVKMPGMDGIEAVEEIMERQPTPILMLSRYTEDGNETTFEALEAGAVDFFPKPDGDVSTTLVQYADDLVEKVQVVSQADISPSVEAETTDDVSAPEHLTHRERVLPTLVIAASTGGPPVVQSILESLPGDIGLRVLVVQHMPGQFTDRYAERLDRLTEFSVSEATNGQFVRANEVAVAKGGHHLVVIDDSGPSLQIGLTKDEPVHSVRPAADVTLESVAESATGPLVSVVLTGMGRDGATGIELTAENGGTTIVQDPESANITSMPENAIATDAVDYVLSPDDIPAQILSVIEEEPVP